MMIFHVAKHPNYTSYEQCVIFNSFPNEFWELVYKYFGLIMMYLLPLVVILFTYSSILLKIYKKFRECQDGKFFTPLRNRCLEIKNVNDVNSSRRNVFS